MGKRFYFSTIAVICGSVVSVLLKYSGETYIEIIKWICIVYVGGQTVTDVVKKKKEE